MTTPAVVMPRMYLLGKGGTITWPVGIMAIALAINVLVFALTPGPDDGQITGGLLSLYITAAIVVVTAARQFLPYVMALGLTRRAFLAGTGLFMLLYCVGTGLLLTALTAFESGTGGYGSAGRFFRLQWLTDVPAWTLPVMFGVPMLVFLSVSALLAAVQLRYGGAGLLLSLAVPVLLGALVILLEAWTDSIGALVRWAIDLTPLAAMGVLALASAAALAGCYLLLRRVAV